MGSIPLDLQRRFEQRWAANSSSLRRPFLNVSLKGWISRSPLLTRSKTTLSSRSTADLPQRRERAEPKPRAVLVATFFASPSPLWLRGLMARGCPRGFGTRRSAIARADQFLLKLQPLVDRHSSLLTLRRQIFYREITTWFRTRRYFSARVHW